ncbi:MAG: rod shape-determining protein MreC [bacterium]|nr:rod shape-determining protein MreC [bacterium]
MRPSLRTRLLNPWIVASLAVVLIAGLHQLGWLSPVEGVAAIAVRPLQRLFVAVGTTVNDGLGKGRNAKELAEENDQLRAQLQRLAVENQRLQQQVSELALLQEQTEFLRQRELPAVSARVIGRDLSSEAQVLVLDRGRHAGIKVGLPVIANDGVLIGRVVEVGEQLTKVMLLTDGRSVTPVAIDGAENAQGVVSGEFGVSLKLDLVPKDVALHPGDIVVTSGLELEIPRGLVIGTVSRVETGGSTFFHVAYLQPLVPYQSLRVAAILLPR